MKSLGSTIFLLVVSVGGGGVFFLFIFFVNKQVHCVSGSFTKPRVASATTENTRRLRITRTAANGSTAFPCCHAQSGKGSFNVLLLLASISVTCLLYCIFFRSHLGV
jgi:hypothetical protein